MRYLTLTELSNELGRPRQFKLMRFLMRRAGIEPGVAGKTVFISVSDLPRIRAELERWENRPRVVA